MRHRTFSELPEEVGEYVTVVNDTRVVPARLHLRRETGGAVEVLLVEPLGDGIWEALARPSRRLRPGERLEPSDTVSRRSSVELVEALGGGRWRVRVEGEPLGELPLPPYIHERPADPERYQTVYARELGSAAAPTAGLHFSPDVLARLDVERITLHVGLDTFRPLTADTLEEHELHGERYAVEPATWTRIEAADRVLAVGTTTTRVLETLARGAPARWSLGPLHHARLRVPSRRRAPHELPLAADDPARARHGVCGDRTDAGAVRARDSRALPLLLVRRRDARPVTPCPQRTCNLHVSMRIAWGTSRFGTFRPSFIGS